MRKKLIWFILGVLVSGGAGPLHAEWHVPATDSRYRIERATDSRDGADTGYFLLCPNGRATSNTFLNIVTTDGKPVGHRILWSAEGEPVKVLFDSSSHAAEYYVYTGSSPYTPPVWTPKSGLFIETRKRHEGEPSDAAAIRKLCDKSGPVLGRSLIPEIFLGVHPHGPNENVVSIIDGILTLRKGGKYDFATISEDASCLLVDGKLIAQWPGWHDCHAGRKGQHAGSVNLDAGPHRIEYLNVKRGDGYIVEAAWRPPGENQFKIIPPDAFAPVATFVVSATDSPPSGPVLARFAWQIEGHYTIGVASFVDVTFNALALGQRYTWEFDDGSREEGRTVDHIFLSPGMRTVKLKVLTPTGTVAVSQKVLVHPLWTQEKGQPRKILEYVKRRLAGGEVPSPSPADLASVYRIAAGEDELVMARKCAALCLQRKGDFTNSDAGVFCEMAEFLKRPEVQEYALAEQAFLMVIESPLFSPVQKAWAMLNLSGLLIHYVGRVDEAQEWLGRIEVARLSDSDRRIKRIYEGDVLFADGHLDLARKTYADIGTLYAPGDTRRALKRQASLESARDYLRRGELDAAEQLVSRIGWDDPEQRMASEPGLIMIRVCLERKEFRRALLLSRRLLPVAETDVRKSEILSARIEICLALNYEDEAAGAYRQLLESCPYSEATARAKGKWGDRLARKQK